MSQLVPFHYINEIILFLGLMAIFYILLIYTLIPKVIPLIKSRMYITKFKDILKKLIIKIITRIFIRYVILFLLTLLGLDLVIISKDLFDLFKPLVDLCYPIVDYLKSVLNILTNSLNSILNSLNSILNWFKSIISINIKKLFKPVRMDEDDEDKTKDFLVKTGYGMKTSYPTPEYRSKIIITESENVLWPTNYPDEDPKSNNKYYNPNGLTPLQEQQRIQALLRLERMKTGKTDIPLKRICNQYFEIVSCPGKKRLETGTISGAHWGKLDSFGNVNFLNKQELDDNEYKEVFRRAVASGKYAIKKNEYDRDILVCLAPDSHKNETKATLELVMALLNNK